MERSLLASKGSRSILQEISTYVPTRNHDDAVEMRGERVIVSAIYLLEMMEDNYTDEEYEQLSKKLISAIRTRDLKKFERGLNKIKEDRNATK